MTASRIVVWRHGQTDWNVQLRFQGHADIPLNEVGRAQVAAAAPAIAALRPDVIISSDLSRARETAGALAALTGQPVATDPRLREIAVGTWEGRTLAEIAEEEPDFRDREMAGDDVRRSPTGETVTEVATRFAAALAEHADALADGQTLLVAAHGLAARVGSCAFLGMSGKDARLLRGMDNAGWLIMDRSGEGAWRMAAYNRVA
ncbi:histidine phosphatase family protein [Naumannella cuiyingiana]|uniref:Putative phosphoglycerate mutase n=1 Tax=Naumannella cuiyingiana TaxID=1347891 RepID=A0A7Z0D711_9ACTN|nr:putative phosphoglycerate mutase [Naumannella cuiyingiana]